MAGVSLTWVLILDMSRIFHHKRTKYGIAASAVPMTTSSTVFVTKYGNTHSAMPHSSGTIAPCFLP